MMAKSKRWIIRLWCGSPLKPQPRLVPKSLRVFETQLEADQWLWLCALQDFENDADAPLYFHQLEEAEDWLFENE